MKFLTFLFFLVLSFYLIGFLLRLAFRWWIVRKSREFEGYAKKMERERSKAGKREGEVIVEQVVAKKRVRRDVGDYVEYEELKDDTRNNQTV